MSGFPEFTDDELLSRFILYSSWIREDATVRPEAFIPYKFVDLSVTRHLGISRSIVWELGRSVAEARALTLYGSAELRASTIKRHPILSLVPTAEPRNHVNIVNFPADKPAQKMIALELAASAQFEQYTLE